MKTQMCMNGESLYCRFHERGSLLTKQMPGKVFFTERPLWESVKEKPKLQWRPQDIGDAGTVGHLQPWNGASPRERLCVLQTGMSKSFGAQMILS